MYNLKERIKAIWCILIDKEYIVFTVTIKNGKQERIGAYISDNASETMIDAGIELLQKVKEERRERNENIHIF